MILAIHQPEFLPWLGFFDKMNKCDNYIILDNVQFAKNNFQNRNRLIDQNGTIFWSTVPVLKTGYMDKQIKDMLIDQKKPWARKNWARISASYCKHPFFKCFCDELESIFAKDFTFLIDLNMALIRFFCRELKINKPIIRSSSLQVNGKRDELLLSICQSQGANTYLSGPTGRQYLKEDLFRKENIKIQYHEFEPPYYSAPSFKPYLSVLDLLFNHGPESRHFLKT